VANLPMKQRRLLLSKKSRVTRTCRKFSSSFPAPAGGGCKDRDPRFCIYCVDAGLQRTAYGLSPHVDLDRATLGTLALTLTVLSALPARQPHGPDKPT
jgi:hypothetical protein